MKTSRRKMIVRSTQGLAALALAPRLAPSFANPRTRYTIGACDWSIGKAGDPSGLALAKEIGLDGLQVSLGSEANDLHLRKPGMQLKYREAAQKSGMKILSLAIGELNNIPYKSDPRTIEWVSDSIDVCRAMDCQVVLLAFFHLNDLKGDAPGTAETVRRLREVAPKAEKAGVILGIESWLSAEEHMDIIERVGSPAIKVYYDVANSEKMGYDIYREIRWLGRQKQICEFHMKENGAVLGQGRIDFKKVRAAMEEIDYSGPMQIEGSVPPGGNLVESYIHNRKFLQEIFGTKS
jgi:L-ribulose-5-phosphate 3-epimerase